MNSKLNYITFLCFMGLVGLMNLNTVQAQDIVNIPDPNFKQALIDHVPVIDTNGDGEISVQEAQAFDGYMDVHDKAIQDLTGLEAFVNITRLFAEDNQISDTVDFSANTALERISCSGNRIEAVNLTQNVALKRFGITDNQLSVIDLSANVNLERLWVYYNQLTKLDISNNTKLEHVVADNNKLKAIDVSQNVNLLSLGVQFNEIKSIDISNNDKLTVLNAWNNKLTSVNVANGNNTNMIIMKVQNNPDLTCIQHDEGFDPSSKPCEGAGWCKDETAMWSTNCADGMELDLMLANKVVLYPNPAQDKVEVAGMDLKRVELYNTQGEKILEKANSTFSVRGLKAGIYFVKVTTTDNKVVYKKLMKN